jgi:hypothetical protein
MDLSWVLARFQQHQCHGRWLGEEIFDKRPKQGQLEKGDWCIEAQFDHRRFEGCPQGVTKCQQLPRDSESVAALT